MKENCMNHICKFCSSKMTKEERKEVKEYMDFEKTMAELEDLLEEEYKKNITNK